MNEKLILTSTDFVIPAGVREIGPSVFRNSENLVSIDIPDSVEKIDNGAFCNCTALTDIKLPAGLH